MSTIHQLQFDFTFPEARRGRSRGSWQVRHLSRRYGLPEAHARLYAAFLGLPVEANHD